MIEDELPTGDMTYSCTAHAHTHGLAGDLIISSTTVNDLVKSRMSDEQYSAVMAACDDLF